MRCRALAIALLVLLASAAEAAVTRVEITQLAGWALRAPAAGAPGTICGLDGSRVPFALTRAERESKGDPRPSLAERYLGRADYVGKVRAVAAALERERYLLAEDVERIVAEAAAAR